MTNKKIKFGTHPTFYGENNITFAFQKGEIGFELEVGNENYRHRSILTMENALVLKNQIEDALISYDEFMVAYGESTGNKKTLEELAQGCSKCPRNAL